jgi:hypothetical protein
LEEKKEKGKEKAKELKNKKGKGEKLMENIKKKVIYLQKRRKYRRTRWPKRTVTEGKRDILCTIFTCRAVGSRG